MSYNVNFGLGGDPAAIALIRENDCDVVFLQETTPDPLDVRVIDRGRSDHLPVIGIFERTRG